MKNSEHFLSLVELTKSITLKQPIKIYTTEQSIRNIYMNIKNSTKIIGIMELMYLGLNNEKYH